MEQGEVVVFRALTVISVTFSALASIVSLIASDNGQKKLYKETA